MAAGGTATSAASTVIHCDPEILSGALVFVGTRAPVRTLLDYLEAGEPLGEFLEDFPTATRDQVTAAFRLAGEVIKEAGFGDED